MNEAADGEMSDSGPCVSVIIPTYNRAHFVVDAVASVFAQDFSDFEVIVVDDGSTDQTFAVMALFNDPRLVFVQQVNRGRSQARNRGLEISRGRYIAFLDSDDLYMPGKLVLQADYLDRHPDVGMVYTSAYCVDYLGEPLEERYFASVSGWIYKSIAFFRPVTITLPTVMARRELFVSAGGFDEKMHRFEDTDMWRRISKVARIDALSAFTCRLRTHAENSLAAQDPEQIVQALEYYAAKITAEDASMGALTLRRGIGRLYYYYGCAFLTVPEWQKMGRALLRRSYGYWFPMWFRQLAVVAYRAVRPRIASARNRSCDVKDNFPHSPRQDFSGNPLSSCKTINRMSPTAYPLVSIVIPVYNGSNYLAEAINSALQQTYPNVEIVVVNDGSKDDGKTEKIALSFGDRIRYYKKENGGVATALNFGIEQMRGDFFSWLSHDDLYIAEKIALQMSAFNTAGNPKTVVYCNYFVFTGNPADAFRITLADILPAKFRYWITTENALHGCTLLIPRAAFELCGKFREDLRTTQDYDLWFRMAAAFSFVHISQHLVKARSHAQQDSLKMSSVVLQECNALLSGFVKQLRADELLDSHDQSFPVAYALLAANLKGRGFLKASATAAELTRFALRDASAGVRLTVLGTHAWGATKYHIVRPFKWMLPAGVKGHLRHLLARRTQLAFAGVDAVRDLSLKEKFSEVYDKNIFGGGKSRSGEGSDMVQTEVIRREIPGLIQELGIRSFLDAPCGDWYWMRHVDLRLERYIGVDIVEAMVLKNRSEFGNEKITFECLNLAESELPRVDMIFSRDCLVHLSFSDALKIIDNFKRSDAKYLLTTTFTARQTNEDLGNGFWRPLNQQLAPFNFPPPILLINEECTEGRNQFTDKCLGLWALQDIKSNLQQA